MGGVILLYLGILGMRDIRNQKIPILWLLAGGFLLPGMGGVRCMEGQMHWAELLAGIIPGLFLLVVAWATQKAGYADGIVLAELGLYQGYFCNAALFTFSLLLLAFAAGVLLVLKKVRRNTRIPYIPFIFVVFMIQELAGI